MTIVAKTVEVIFDCLVGIILHVTDVYSRLLGSGLTIRIVQELNVRFNGSLHKAHKALDCRQSCIQASSFEVDELQVESSDVLFGKEWWNVVIFSKSDENFVIHERKQCFGGNVDCNLSFSP